MKIILKTILITTFVTSLTLVVLFFVISQISVSGNNNTDKLLMKKNIERVSATLDKDINNLDSVNVDYAVWDASYTFLEGKNENYTINDFNQGSLERINADFAAVLLNNGSILMARQYTSGVERDLNSYDTLYLYIKNDVYAMISGHSDNAYKGFFLFPQGGTLLSIEPILKSDGLGPSLGVIVMGRILNNDLSKELSEQSHLNITIYSYNDFLPNNIKSIKEELLAHLTVINFEDENIITGYLLVKDVYDRPAAIIKIQDNRIVYSQGKSARNAVLISAFMVCIILIFLISFLVNIFVIRKILKIKNDMSDIANKGNFSKRIGEDGKDELTLLAKTINLAFNSLEKTTEEKKAIFDANPDAYFHVDPAGILIDYKLPEFFDKKLLENKSGSEINLSLFFGPEMIEKFIFSKLESSKSGMPIVIESDVDFNGSKKYVEYRIVAMHNNRSLVLVRDITDRKNNELEISKKNDELERFNKFAIDRETKMIEMKRQIEKLKEK